MTFQWNSPINNPQRLLPWLWLFMLLMSPVSQADQVPWLDSVEQAMQASQQTGRPILLHFYSNNCPPCKLLDNRAFEDKQLLQSMSEQIIPVKVNVDDHRELADRFQVTRWPTDLYLFPNGTELYRAVSPQDPAVYRQMLDRVALRNRDWVLEQNARFAATERRNALANNRPNPPLQTGMERTQPTALDNPTNQMPTQRRISAAPVSYPVANSDEEVATTPMSSSATLTRTEEQPVNRYKSVRQSPPAGSLSSMTNPYAFEPPSSNMAEMDSPNPPAAMTPPPTRQPTSASLVSSPSSASASANATSASAATGTKSSDVGNVVFDGCCPVALAGSNPAWVEGNASFAVRHRGRVYYCQTEEARARFLAEPDRYSPIFSGYDIVRFMKDGEIVEGARQFGCWFNNRIYLFSTRETYSEFVAIKEKISADFEQLQNAGRVAEGETRTLQR